MPNNDFTISSREPKLARVQVSRKYLIEILKKSFPDLDFPMCYQDSEWSIEPQYDPMDMSRKPEPISLVVTRYAEKKGA